MPSASSPSSSSAAASSSAGRAGFAAGDTLSVGSGSRESGRTLRINIAQGAFLPVPPRLGGAVEKAWYALGRELASLGHRVTHLGRSFDGLPDDEHDGGVHYLRVPGFATPSRLWQLKLYDLVYSLRLRRVLPDADVLVTNTFWLPIVERRARKGRPYVHVARYPKGQLKYYPQRAILQTVSSPIREAILAEVPTAADRTTLVPYPVAPVYCIPLNPTPERRVLFTGRVHPEKGIHLLIDAFVRARAHGLTSWKLRIVGPWETAQGGGGPAYREKLLTLAGAGENQIEFVGPIFDESRLVDEYRQASFFVYPSLAEKGETFGLAVLEAMAAGCVPVVSDLACFKDFVTEGETGLFFNHRAADAAELLARRLGELASNPQRLHTLRGATWKQSRQYTLASVADQFATDFRRFVHR